jgi:hypothetical protein
LQFLLSEILFLEIFKNSKKLFFFLPPPVTDPIGSHSGTPRQLPNEILGPDLSNQHRKTKKIFKKNFQKKNQKNFQKKKSKKFSKKFYPPKKKKKNFVFEK